MYVTVLYIIVTALVAGRRRTSRMHMNVSAVIQPDSLPTDDSAGSLLSLKVK